MEQNQVNQDQMVMNPPNDGGEIQNLADAEAQNNQANSTHWYTFDWKTESWVYNGTNGKNLFNIIQYT